MIWRPLLGALLIAWLNPVPSSAQDAASASAASPQPASALPAPQAELEPPIRFTLSNGLRVALQRDPRQPRVAISVVYAVGSRNDPAGYRGLAHLVEHLMFEGSSDRATSDFFEQIESVGTTGVNGTTSRDLTSYFHELPRAQLELGLWLEASRMAYLLKWLDQKDLERARIAVIREWESHVESSGRAGMQAVVTKTLYPASHPYHHAHDDPDAIESVTPSGVQWFFQQWYGPGNATLAVAGDFDPQLARRSIEAWFGSIAASISNAKPAAANATAALRGTREVDMVWSAAFQSCDMVWLLPPLDAQEDLVLDVLSEYLSLELDALVAADTELQSADAGYYESALSGELTLRWATDDAREGKRERAAIEALIDKTRRGVLDQGRVLRAREHLRQAYLFSEVNLIERSLRLAHPEGHTDAWNGKAMAEHVAAISAAQLSRAATRFMPKDDRLLVCSRHKDGAPHFGKVKDDRLLPAKRGKP